MKKIIFRADASPEIGYGHFVRTLALASMLKDDFNCVFVTCEPNSFQQQELAGVCTFVSLPNNESHFDAFIEILSSDDIVVLDNYFFDTDYQKRIKQIGCKLICIDDSHDKHYVADIVINHAPGFTRSDYSLEPYTQLCLGLNWALLRPEFLALGNSDLPQDLPKSLFICFGGADIYNLSLRIAKLALSIPDVSLVHVVVGAAYKYTKELDVLVDASCGKIKKYSCLSAQEMVDLMKVSTVGVVPASGILIESIILNLPVVYGYYVDNQIQMCKRNGDNEGMRCMGDFLLTSDSEIASAVSDLLKSSSLVKESRDPQKNYSSLFSSDLTLRQANLDDSLLYFNWANDPLTRSMSFNKDIIQWEDHCKWFARRVESSNCFLYLFYKETEAIGQVRFDLNSDIESVLSVSLDKKYRGLGYGKKIIQQSLMQLSLDTQVKEVLAFVESKNIASAKMFESVGLNKIPHAENIFCYKIKIK